MNDRTPPDDARGAADLDALIRSAARLTVVGEHEAAIAEYRRALALAPDNGGVLLNMGVLLGWVGRMEEALQSLERAVQAIPQVPQAWYNLGNLLYRRGNLAEAESALWRALSLCGGDQDAGFVSGVIGAQALTLQGQGEVARLAAFLHEAAGHFPAHEDECLRLGLLSLSMDASVDGATLLARHREWAERFADPLTRAAVSPGHDATRRRLRLGYVSADLREHAVARFLEPVLRNHDADRFEVWCLDNGRDADATTARLRTLVPHWQSINGLDDAAADALVRTLGIDILIDLSGHTAGNRLGLFARRPAPLQIAYLGYSATTGMLAMDYRISDSIVDPSPTADRHYREKLLRVDPVQWCYEPPAEARATPVRAAPHAPLRFGVFNRFDKVSDAALKLWGRVLARVPGSLLYMRGVPEGSARQALQERLERAGCDPSRVVPRGRVAASEYWLSYHEADIALDTFPYNGATTTCESLWMGLPVVTLCGAGGAARYGASLLGAAGMQEFVARDEDAYVELAAGLAADPVRLAALRDSLRERVAASALADAAGFTRALEAAYLAAWQGVAA
ncbi:MAG: tetratricopeptide repeat protein [Burkholderiales bacterium]|nr:tetratricopeptide repeat protein [Burkholderiales bacterium]